MRAEPSQRQGPSVRIVFHKKIHFNKPVQNFLIFFHVNLLINIVYYVYIIINKYIHLIHIQAIRVAELSFSVEVK